VKDHFNKLKVEIEKDWPVRVVLIDKERGNASKDFWQQIRSEIEKCSLAIFDVTTFRPNVVLELGYALAIKDEKQVLITFDQRKPTKGKAQEWLLTDISHLHHVHYRQLQQLDEKIREHLSIVPAIAAFESLCSDAESTAIPEKYKIEALKVMRRLEGVTGLTDQQLEAVTKGSGVNKTKLTTLLKKHKMARRDPGKGRWYSAVD
jgi:hypothetical protein